MNEIKLILSDEEADLVYRLMDELGDSIHESDCLRCPLPHTWSNEAIAYLLWGIAGKINPK